MGMSWPNLTEAFASHDVGIEGLFVMLLAFGVQSGVFFLWVRQYRALRANGTAERLTSRSKMFVGIALCYATRAVHQLATALGIVFTLIDDTRVTSDMLGLWSLTMFAADCVLLCVAGSILAQGVGARKNSDIVPAHVVACSVLAFVYTLVATLSAALHIFGDPLGIAIASTLITAVLWLLMSSLIAYCFVRTRRAIVDSHEFTHQPASGAAKQRALTITLGAFAVFTVFALAAACVFVFWGPFYGLYLNAAAASLFVSSLLWLYQPATVLNKWYDPQRYAELEGDDVEIGDGTGRAHGGAIDDDDDDDITVAGASSSSSSSSSSSLSSSSSSAMAIPSRFGGGGGDGGDDDEMLSLSPAHSAAAAMQHGGSTLSNLGRSPTAAAPDADSSLSFVDDGADVTDLDGGGVI